MHFTLRGFGIDCMLLAYPEGPTSYWPSIELSCLFTGASGINTGDAHSPISLNHESNSGAASLQQTLAVIDAK